MTPAPSAPPAWFLDIAVAVIGACIGSFLNVVIHRVPRDTSIVRPGSRCECGAPIAWRDNIPILSWLILRGRARCCGRAISRRYPGVEFLTAAAFLACWLRLPPWPAVCGAVFLSALIAATFIDLEHMVIPDALSVGLGIAGVILSLLVPSLHVAPEGLFLLDSLRSGAASLEGLLLGSGLVLWIAATGEFALKKEVMGMGDVVFVGAIGAFCGWHGAVFAIFGGSLVGVAWLLIALALRAVRPADLSSRIPFGPMLAIAGAAYFLFLRGPVDAWFTQIAALFPG